MLRYTEAVEKKIERLLEDRFALVFDGSSCGSRFLVAVFASLPADNRKLFHQLLLSFSTFEDETTKIDAEHRYYVQYVLGCYKKTWVNIVALVGYNCSMNIFLSSTKYIALVGCASYRLNLTIKDLIKTRKKLFDKVQKVMLKMRY